MHSGILAQGCCLPNVRQGVLSHLHDEPNHRYMYGVPSTLPLKQSQRRIHTRPHALNSVCVLCFRNHSPVSHLASTTSAGSAVCVVKMTAAGTSNDRRVADETLSETKPGFRLYLAYAAVRSGQCSLYPYSVPTRLPNMAPLLRENILSYTFPVDGSTLASQEQASGLAGGGAFRGNSFRIALRFIVTRHTSLVACPFFLAIDIDTMILNY
jgi:hypothetical protein